MGKYELSLELTRIIRVEKCDYAYRLSPELWRDYECRFALEAAPYWLDQEDWGDIVEEDAVSG